MVAPPNNEPSRHFLGCKVDKVRWLPAGLSLNYGERVLVTGGWHSKTELQEGSHRLAIHSVRLSLDESGGPTGRPPSIDTIQTWEHKGTFNDLQVVPTGSGDLFLLAASSEGCVSLVKLGLPPAGSGGIAAIKILDSDGSGNCAVWKTLPKAGEVAMVTLGGTISVANLASSAGQPPQTLFDSGGYCTFSAVRWASPGVLLTSGSAPGISAWDRRAASSAHGPELRAGATGAAGTGAAPLRYACIDTLQAQMHVCAAGGENGELTLWDLRYPDKAVSCASAQQGSDGACVWELRFDAVAAQSSGAEAAPRILACTEGGVLQRASPAGPPLVLAHEVAMSINSFAIEPTVGLELAAVTDGEGLLYWSAEAREDIVYGGQ